MCCVVLRVVMLSVIVLIRWGVVWCVVICGGVGRAVLCGVELSYVSCVELRCVVVRVVLCC